MPNLLTVLCQALMSFLVSDVLGKGWSFVEYQGAHAYNLSMHQVKVTITEFKAILGYTGDTVLQVSI